MQLQQEKIKANATLSQLQKLEDSKTFDMNKRNSQVVGGAAASTTAGSGSADKGENQGFLLFHVMLVALISLIIGAFVSRSGSQ